MVPGMRLCIRSVRALPSRTTANTGGTVIMISSTAKVAERGVELAVPIQPSTRARHWTRLPVSTTAPLQNWPKLACSSVHCEEVTGVSVVEVDYGLLKGRDSHKILCIHVLMSDTTHIMIPMDAYEVFGPPDEAAARSTTQSNALIFQSRPGRSGSTVKAAVAWLIASAIHV